MLEGAWIKCLLSLDYSLDKCIYFVQRECEKYLVNGKDVFWSFKNLEKGYDTNDRHRMWQMLKVCGVGRKLLNAVQSFYLHSKACVRGRNVCE